MVIKMRIEISSSSNDNIDEIYKEESRKLCAFLAREKNELIWGSGNRSIMGICYDEFAKEDCKISGFTTEKYVDEIDTLPKASHVVEKDTFDLKKDMFNICDMILILPGGTGTVSELFTYLEEVRSNDEEKILVVYNVNNHFKKSLEVIDDLIERNFNSSSIYDYLHIVNNLDEFKELYNSLK